MDARDDMLPTETFTELLAREEAKRNRNWDPVQRQAAMEAALAWAERQWPERNTKQECLRLQAIELAARGELPASFDDLPTQAGPGGS